MKKTMWILSLVVGTMILIGIVVIAALSEKLGSFIKTWGFMGLGYLGFILFAYGWMKLSKKPK
jgi:hypothetical protein